TPLFGCFRPLIDRRQSQLGRTFDDGVTIPVQHRRTQHVECYGTSRARIIHRDQAENPRRGLVPRWAIRTQSRRGQAAPYRGHRLVDQTLSEYRAAEGPADERCYHRLSQCRAPLSANQMCEKLWTAFGFGPGERAVAMRQCEILHTRLSPQLLWSR